MNWFLGSILLFTFPVSADGVTFELLAPPAFSMANRMVPVDFDGDEDLDLVCYPGSYQDPAGYWMENLGDRGFSPPRLIQMLPLRLNEAIDESASLVKSGDGNDPRIFVSRFRVATTEVYEPLILTPVEDGAAPVETKAIAPPDLYRWQTIELEDDGVTDFVQLSRDAAGSLVLRIRDLQPDGSGVETAAVVLEGDFSLRDYHPRIEAVDMDGDGDRDLVIRATGVVMVLERTGPRSFGAEVVIPLNGHDAKSLVDMDGDGLPDLLLNHGSWRRNEGGLVFSSEPVALSAEWTSYSALEVVRERPGESALIMVLAPGGGGWEMVSSPAAGDEPVVVTPLPELPTERIQLLALEDIDGDGRLDLLAGMWEAGENEGHAKLCIGWGTSDGFTALQVVHVPDLDRPRVDVFTADFDGDDRVDVIVGPDEDGKYVLWRNKSGGSLEAAEAILALDAAGFTVKLIAAGDVDGDGLPDLVCRCVRTSDSVVFIGVAQGVGDGSFEPLALGVLEGVSDFGAGALVDWDGDGDADVVADGVLLENVGGAFTEPAQRLIEMGLAYDMWGHPYTIGFTRIGDLDGDGALDIVSGVYGPFDRGSDPGEIGGIPGLSAPIMRPQRMAIRYNDGTGEAGPIVEMDVRVGSSDPFGDPAITGDVAITDLDGDGWDDLVIYEMTEFDFLGNPRGMGIRWLRNPGDGSRDPASWESSVITGSTVPGRSFGDFDGDGTSEWVGTGGYVKATPAGPVSTVKPDLVEGVGLSWRYSLVAVEDLDADGDCDFIFRGRGEQAVYLVRNPGSDAPDPITRALIAAGVPRHLAGPRHDADGDGRDNATELLEGTDPLTAGDAGTNAFQLGFRPSEYSTEALRFGFRLPWQVAGLPPGTTPRELGLSYQLQHSYDLETWWSVHEGVVLERSEGDWLHYALESQVGGVSRFFRLESRFAGE